MGLAFPHDEDEVRKLGFLSDPHVIGMCQSMESSGTVHIALTAPANSGSSRITILPSRRSINNSCLWAELPGTDYQHHIVPPLVIFDFPVALYCKLLHGDEVVDGDYSVYSDHANARLYIKRRNNTVSIECSGCKVGADPAGLLAAIPQDIRSPDIVLLTNAPPFISRLCQRLGRLRKHTDIVQISGNASGNLYFSLSTGMLTDWTAEYGGWQIMSESVGDNDAYRLVGVRVGIGALVAALRAGSRGSANASSKWGVLERLQVAIANRAMLLMVMFTGTARITAVLPHCDN